MLGKPRLRDSHLTTRPYELGRLPDEAIYNIGRSLAYSIAVGNTDLAGEKWEKIFSGSINGKNLSSPLGLADVVLDSFAWSVKTVKSKNPHTAKIVRIISGRNAVNYSYGIDNPLDDINLTGEAVLSIFNERIKTAKSVYKDLTHSILVRSEDLTSFAYFEKEAELIDTKNISWKLNSRGNLEGYDTSGKHLYTWQPSGGQFTILYEVPENAQRFTLKQPTPLEFDSVIKMIGFNNNWVTMK